MRKRDRMGRPCGDRGGDDRGGDIGGADLVFAQDRGSAIGSRADELDREGLRRRDAGRLWLAFRLRPGPEGPSLVRHARLAIEHEEGVHRQLGRKIEADALPVLRAIARATSAQSSAIASELASCSLRRAS